MKTIGLIGSMSWEGRVTYYKIFNQIVKEQLGGFQSAKCIYREENRICRLFIRQVVTQVLLSFV